MVFLLIGWGDVLWCCLLLGLCLVGLGYWWREVFSIEMIWLSAVIRVIGSGGQVASFIFYYACRFKYRRTKVFICTSQSHRRPGSWLSFIPDSWCSHHSICCYTHHVNYWDHNNWNMITAQSYRTKSRDIARKAESNRSLIRLFSSGRISRDVCSGILHLYFITLLSIMCIRLDIISNGSSTAY